MFSHRAFSMAGPAAWNSLPDYLQDPSHSFDSFCRDLKTFLVLLVYTAHWRLCGYVLYKYTVDVDIDIQCLLACSSNPLAHVSADWCLKWKTGHQICSIL